MWRKIKWGIRIVVVLFLLGFLHYTLPQRDVVRITNSYNRLTTVGENWMFYAVPDTGTGESAQTRDIRFIEAVFPDESVIVYRNEDTGWVWPPYFKYDSSNLQAEATNFKSTKAAPQFVAVTHYGWRIPFISIYPNAVSMRLVDGPDVRLIPWLNIFLLATLILLILMIRRMWRQFWERTVDPAIDAVDARADAARDSARGFWGRISGWFGTWRGKPRR